MDTDAASRGDRSASGRLTATGSAAMFMAMVHMTDLLRVMALALLLVAAPLRAYAQAPSLPGAETAAGMAHAAHLHADVPCARHAAVPADCHHHAGHAPHCSGCLHVSLTALPIATLPSLPDAAAITALEPLTGFDSPALPLPTRPPKSI